MKATALSDICSGHLDQLMWWIDAGQAGSAWGMWKGSISFEQITGNPGDGICPQNDL